MSGKKTRGSNKPGKDQGIAHKVFDEVVKFKTMIITDIGKFKTEVIGVIKDLGEKHNALAAQVEAQGQMLQNIAGFVASKLGDFNGSTEARYISIAKSIRGVDLNVLAIGEMLKEVIGQLTQVDAFIGNLHTQTGTKALELSPEDIEALKKSAEEWYKELLRSAFAKAQENMREQERAADAAYEAEQKKAKEAAEKAAAEQKEQQTLEDECKKAALDDQSLAAKTSGGQGSPFPEGAEIFGG